MWVRRAERGTDGPHHPAASVVLFSTFVVSRHSAAAVPQGVHALDHGAAPLAGDQAKRDKRFVVLFHDVRQMLCKVPAGSGELVDGVEKPVLIGLWVPRAALCWIGAVVAEASTARGIGVGADGREQPSAHRIPAVRLPRRRRRHDVVIESEHATIRLVVVHDTVHTDVPVLPLQDFIVGLVAA